MCVRVCICVCVRVSVCLSICLPACLSVCLSACLPVCLPACLSACLSVCLPLFGYIIVCCSATFRRSGRETETERGRRKRMEKRGRKRGREGGRECYRSHQHQMQTCIRSRAVMDCAATASIAWRSVCVKACHLMVCRYASMHVCLHLPAACGHPRCLDRHAQTPAVRRAHTHTAHPLQKALGRHLDLRRRPFGATWLPLRLQQVEPACASGTVSHARPRVRRVHAHGAANSAPASPVARPPPPPPRPRPRPLHPLPSPCPPSACPGSCP